LLQDEANVFYDKSQSWASRTPNLTSDRFGSNEDDAILPVLRRIATALSAAFNFDSFFEEASTGGNVLLPSFNVVINLASEVKIKASEAITTKHI